MIVTRAYDGIEHSSDQRLEDGYFAVTKGEVLEVRSAISVAGHTGSRFSGYVYAKSADGRRGWVPDFVLAPHNEVAHIV